MHENSVPHPCAASLNLDLPQILALMIASADPNYVPDASGLAGLCLEAISHLGFATRIWVVTDVEDRLNAEHDYEVNLKAELEIMLLHDKVDLLREGQWGELLAIQKEQVKLLGNLIAKKTEAE